MINIIEILMIYGLVGMALYLNNKNEVLRLENKRLIDIIKREKEWFETDKKCSINLARVDERLKISDEEYRKKCEEYHKQCEEINKKHEVK